MRGHIAVKSANCVACRRCALACAVEHSASRDLFLSMLETPVPEPRVEIREYRGLNVPLECRHCENPQCAMVCPTGALYRIDQAGSVVLARERCVGCRSCTLACHFGVPRMQADGRAAQKCDQCHERLARGEPPACTAACPTGALVFVREDELRPVKTLIERFAAAVGER